MILGQVVPEKSLTEKKFTHKHTEKAKTIYPLYTSYTGGINMKALGLMVSEKKIFFYIFPIISLWRPMTPQGVDKIWLLLAHWLWRYSCLKVLTHAQTDGCTDGWTDGRQLDSHPISSPCEPAAQVS